MLEKPKFLLYISILFAFVVVVNCKNLNNANINNNNIFNEQLVEGVFQSGRDLFQCDIVDFKCLIGAADVMLQRNKNAMLAQADAEYQTTKNSRDSTSSSSSNESPSELTETIQGIISQMSDLLKDTVTGWFRDSKEGNKDGKEDTNETEETETNDGDDDEEEENKNLAEARGKKKKKLKSLMKFLILGAVLKAKLTLLLQLLSAALQIKFFIIALAGLLINKIRLWYELKKGHQPQKVIYYEHAQHQHHYDHEDEHGFWGRAYEVPKEEGEQDEEGPTGQDLAYKNQRPIPWQRQEHHQQPQQQYYQHYKH